MDSAGPDLDEEQHVKPGQADRLNSEEVDGEELVGVLPYELLPGTVTPTGSGE